MARNAGPLHGAGVQTIFSEIMSACRALEKRLCVAYLGPAGTFTEQAAQRQFGTAIDAVACASIDEVFRVTESGQANFGVVPLENSTEGSVNQTLDLLLHTTLSINAEVALPIHHNLLTQHGTMVGVQRICAHVQALAQCKLWLDRHYPTVECQPVASNAEAARLASLDPSVAAIAGESATQHYHLQVVEMYIQDDPHNRTRFAVLGHLPLSQAMASDHDRTSMILSVPHKTGAVCKLLAPLAAHNISITRLESRPARMGKWEYYFYVDIEGHAQDKNVAEALAELQQHAAFFKMLGSYPAAV